MNSPAPPLSLVHSTLLAWVASQRWMLHRPIAEAMSAIVLRHARGERLGAAEIERHAEVGRARTRSVRMERGMSLDPDDDELWYRNGVNNSVAVVPVTGMISAYSRLVNGMSQPEGRTPADIEYGLSRAVAAQGVRAVVLKIDSGGGTVAGCHDICESIERARAFVHPATQQGVPVVAYGWNMLGSAAYLIASQCDAVFCSEQALVGSIGCCTCVYDSSRSYAEQGVKALLVASGPHKGAGLYDGAEVTAEHLASIQAEVDSLCEWFVGRVASGRGMDIDQAAALATGDVWVGERAVAAGLCDGVCGFGELIERLSA